MKKLLGLLMMALMLTSAALAADLDTPRVGAAVCMPEEQKGTVTLHEAPDGRSETLMRYFQGAPLQVLEFADGWAHVRMGMEGDSLEGYIRQERLKYGAEAMREVRPCFGTYSFESDVQVYEARDTQSAVVEDQMGPTSVTVVGSYGQWAAYAYENGWIQTEKATAFSRWTPEAWRVWPMEGEISRDEAVQTVQAMFAEKRAEWGLAEDYADERLIDAEIEWACDGLKYDARNKRAFYAVKLFDPLVMHAGQYVLCLYVELSTSGEVLELYNMMPRPGLAACAPEDETDTVILYAAPDEQSDALFHYYSGVPVEVLDVTRKWAHVQVGEGEAILDGYMRVYDIGYGAYTERDVPHIERDVRAGELTVYAAPDENATILRKTMQSVSIIGVGADGWAQLSWNIAKDETEDNETGFVCLGNDAEIGKPSRREYYYVHPIQGELSFDEAEEKAKEFALQGPTKDSETWSQAWMNTREGLDSAECTVALHYGAESGEASYEVWFYQAGNEMQGVAVEMTSHGTLIDAGEGFG